MKGEFRRLVRVINSGAGGKLSPPPSEQVGSIFVQSPNLEQALAEGGAKLLVE